MKKNNILFITIIISIITFYITLQKSRNIEMYVNYKNKTVYVVWRNLIKGSPNNGFGDKIRGLIAAYEYCLNHKYRIVLDATDDITAKFLKNVKSKEYDSIKNKEVILLINELMTDTTENAINKHFENTDKIYIFITRCPMNDDCFVYKNNDVLSKEVKNFAKYICEPMDFLQDEINIKLKILPQNYGIQHFRFDDNVFTNDIDENDPLFIKYFTILNNTYKDTDVLFTNSNKFKQYAINKLNIKTVDCDGGLCKIGHTGMHDDNYEKTKNTFIEFFILSKAKYVKTMSVYNWVSNFVKWPCIIYDVPLEDHKKE